MSAQLPSYSDWIWSPEHRRYYCYRYTDDGRAEYMWSDAKAQDQDRTRISSSWQGRGAKTPTAATTTTTTTTPHTDGATSEDYYHYDDGGNPITHYNHHHFHKPPPPSPPSPPPDRRSSHSKDKESAPQRQRHQNPTAPMPPPPPPPKNQQQQPSDGRLRRGSAEDVRRFQDGEEASMAVEERGQVVRSTFVVRRGRLDAQGHHWEYQLWHEDGTAYDGGHWFREAELS